MRVLVLPMRVMIVWNVRVQHFPFPGAKAYEDKLLSCWKKIETELTASVMKKKERFKTYEVWTKQVKTCEFWGSPLFPSYVQHKKQEIKQSIHLAYASLTQGCLELYAVRSLEKEDFLQNSLVLSCFVKMRKRTRKMYSPMDDERWEKSTSAFDT